MTTATAPAVAEPTRDASPGRPVAPSPGRPAAPRRPVARVPAARLAFVDSLKVGLTALVIAHHAGQAYGPTGGRWPIFDVERAAILGPFFAVNAAFFMGLFFLLSGYFLPISFDGKGPSGFLRDRFLRLGVPLALATLALFAPLAYGAYTAGGGTLGFLPYLIVVYIGRWRVDFGHLWFIAHLLAYGTAYAAWRILTRRGVTTRASRAAGASRATDQTPPTGTAILGFALILAAVTALVRLAFPVDRWVSLFGFLPAEPAHLPQYVALFVVGIVAARRGWLSTLTARTGWRWLAIGATAAALRYAYTFAPLLVGPGVLPPLAGGGATVGSLLWSTWEAFICVGLCVGLITLGRERFRVPGPLMRMAAPNAFGAYVVHVLPVVGLQLALVGVALPPLAKFAVVTIIAVPLSFLIAAGLRRLPGLRSVL